MDNSPYGRSIRQMTLLELQGFLPECYASTRIYLISIPNHSNIEMLG